MAKTGLTQENMYEAFTKHLADQGYSHIGDTTVTQNLIYELWVDLKDRKNLVLVEKQFSEADELQFVRIFKEIAPSIGGEYNPFEYLIAAKNMSNTN